MENLDELVPRAAGGDPEAFRDLYDQAYPVVEKECLRVLHHNPQDAEDAAQEAFLKIYRKLGTLDDPQKFPAWCRMIAHNAAIDLIQHRHRKGEDLEYRPPVSDEQYLGMDTLDDPDPEDSPEKQAEQEMVRELLQTAVDGLGPDRAMCFALYRQGVPYKDISAKLSIPVGTVKSHVHYAKATIRKEIERIEQKEGIRIHGFVLVPVGSAVQVQAPGAGFVQASVADTGAKERVWKQVEKEFPHASKPVPLWSRILAMVLAGTVIAGGITFGVRQAGRTNFSTPRIGAGQADGGSRKQAGNSGRVRVTENSKYADTVEFILTEIVTISPDSIIKTEDTRTLEGERTVTESDWNRDSLTLLIKVSINYFDSQTSEISPKVQSMQRNQYYTFVTFHHICWQSGVPDWESEAQPTKKTLPIFVARNGKQQHVAGYATEQEARKAARIELLKSYIYHS